MKKFLYYFWSILWNFPTTLIGSIVALALLLTGSKPYKFGPTIVVPYKINIGGGFSFSFFTFINENYKSSYHILAHEYGHSLQGLILGPFWLLIVGLPSVVRFHYRERLYNKNPEKYNQLPPYDSIWFEGTATKYGKKYSSVDWINNKRLS